MFDIFSKITRRHIISQKIEQKEAGLYFYFIFPVAVIFFVTFVSARIFSHLIPNLFINLGGVHIHHFTYGFFVLAIAGYLALIHNGPRAKYFISLLYGLGLGLAFDEFGMWLRLKDADTLRWNYDGLLVVLGLFFIIISAKRGVGVLKILWPFKTKSGKNNEDVGG